MPQLRVLRPSDTGTHPGGDLIHRVAPWMSLRLGDSVETGQVGTSLPGRGHPPAASAAAAGRGPSGQPGAAAVRAPQTAAKRRGGGGSTAAGRCAALLPVRQRSFRVRPLPASWGREDSTLKADPRARLAPGKETRIKWSHRRCRHCGS